MSNESEQKILNAIDELRSELKAETKQWDERFFQLSKDTLTFVRSVISAGVIVAVLVPGVKELVPMIVQTFKN